MEEFIDALKSRFKIANLSASKIKTFKVLISSENLFIIIKPINMLRISIFLLKRKWYFQFLYT